MRASPATLACTLACSDANSHNTTRHSYGAAVSWTGTECHGVYCVAFPDLVPVAGITARSFAIGAASGSGTNATLQLLVVDEAGALLEARCGCCA